MPSPYETPGTKTATSGTEDSQAGSLAPRRHQIQRVRHEVRRRALTVTSLDYLTPRMLRVGLTSPELHDFVSLAADDHIKLFFPAGDDTVMRDFTPRAFDAAKGALWIDFALHQAGPATEWASAAKIGDTLQIGGPRGSAIVPDDYYWHLLIGDETALPAMARRVEELAPGGPVAVYAIVANTEEAMTFQSPADLTQTWIVRDGDDDAAQLRAALETFTRPPATASSGSRPRARSPAPCASTWSRNADIRANG
jgi:NADPH-dependent ferric siderophore reductase